MWLKFIDNLDELLCMYDEPPKVEQVYITFLRLKEDGRLLLSIELNEFPKKPPIKWKGCNTLNITLTFMGIKSVQIYDWYLDNIYSFKFEKSNGYIEIKATDEGNRLRMQFQCLNIFISSMDAYIVKES